MTKGFVHFSRSHTGRKRYGSAWSPHKALLFYIVTKDYYSSKKTTLYHFFLATLRYKVNTSGCSRQAASLPTFCFAVGCSKVAT
jgi:hypothetical protein